MILLLLAQAIYTVEQLIAAGAILLFLLAIIVWVALGSRNTEETDSFQTRKPSSTHTPSREKKLSPDINSIRVLRGGAFVGNRLRFKVKIVNDSQYTITDLVVQLISYPRDALKFDGVDDDLHFAKIEPGGFRSPSFEFIPTLDCVKGEIIATVTYIDTKGKAHSQTTRPFVIRAVCDLLIPEEISTKDFELTINELHHGDMVVSVDEWTPEEMYQKAMQIVEEANFHKVTSQIDSSDGVVHAKIEGWARGKYTGKRVGVRISITGPQEKKGASCTIHVSGEDSALVYPAIEDLRARLTSWLCPQCKSMLSVDEVALLRNGEVVQCRYCGVAIGR